MAQQGFLAADHAVPGSVEEACALMHLQGTVANGRAPW